MVSISSKGKITERTKEFLNKERIWQTIGLNRDLMKIESFLEKEYNLIPESERIGKGSVYISKIVAEVSGNYLQKVQHIDSFAFIAALFAHPDSNRNNHMKNYAIALIGELATFSEENFQKAMLQTKIWAEHPRWEIREMSGQVIRKGLKVFPIKSLTILKEWSTSESDNLRRLSIESLRPLADIKWLRDPKKNDCILEILALNKADPSVYVRKSVGNNLKDLTKYMPEKILTLVGEWVKETGITVTDNLSSKTKKELGAENFYLIWTLKHALRWLKERNTESHNRIKCILGENYILYFDEKKNKKAEKK